MTDPAPSEGVRLHTPHHPRGKTRGQFSDSAELAGFLFLDLLAPQQFSARHFAILDASGGLG